MTFSLHCHHYRPAGRLTCNNIDFLAKPLSLECKKHFADWKLNRMTSVRNNLYLTRYMLYQRVFSPLFLFQCVHTPLRILLGFGCTPRKTYIFPPLLWQGLSAGILTLLTRLKTWKCSHRARQAAKHCQLDRNICAQIKEQCKKKKELGTRKYFHADY